MLTIRADPRAGNEPAIHAFVKPLLPASSLPLHFSLVQARSSLFAFRSPAPPVKYHLVQQDQVKQPEGTDNVAPDHVVHPVFPDKDTGGADEHDERSADGNGDPPDPAGSRAGEGIVF